MEMQKRSTQNHSENISDECAKKKLTTTTEGSGVVEAVLEQEVVGGNTKLSQRSGPLH